MHNLLKLPKFGFQLILGWLIVLPLSFLIRKQKNLISLIGRDNGIFTDNVKYFYLFLHNLKPDGIEYYFITENRNTYQELRDSYLPVLYYPSFKAVFVLLRSRLLIVDNWTWITNIKYYLLHRANKIQIWHGVPLKKIELDRNFRLDAISSLAMRFRDLLGFRYPKYNCIVSTSDFISEKAFSSAFKPMNIIVTGYPRNDIFFSNIRNEVLIGTDRTNYSKILRHKESGHKIVVYTPTFRDTGGDIINDSGINLETLSRFAEDNKIIFIFKFHPNPDSHSNLKKINNIIEYDNSKDIYPVLKISDLLITDYSSTYFDYLLLNKPVIFFSFDLEKYLKKDREIYFDYSEYTPGPVLSNQAELQQEIVSILKENLDSYKDHRLKIRDKIFLHKDNNASSRLWHHISENYVYRDTI